jgi:hypothetical protein
MRCLPIAAQALRSIAGEQLERHLQGLHGIAWTARIETAQMFATRRTLLKDGIGIVLCADVLAHAIAAGPTAHSISLKEDEYIVDPRLIKPRAYIAT